MPHAAFYVLGPQSESFKWLCERFQCRTQHSMCWDSVVPSPCPTWAEKPFWKVVRFSRCFCCQNAFSERKIAWQIASTPCAARAAPFWKIRAVECGLRAPADHFPLFHFDDDYSIDFLIFQWGCCTKSFCLVQRPLFHIPNRISIPLTSCRCYTIGSTDKFSTDILAYFYQRFLYAIFRFGEKGEAACRQRRCGSCSF